MSKREAKMKWVTERGLAEEDFYFSEKGFLVFTATYHLKRGYCCKNGCKHCPYGYSKEKFIS